MNQKGPGVLEQLMALLALLALAGFAVLAAFIGLTWTPRQTDNLIMAGAAVCGSGLAVFGVVFGLVLGIGLLRRMSQSQSQEPPASTPPALSWREPQPPMLANETEGEWRSVGPAGYDLWDGKDGSFARDLDADIELDL